jgi:maltooligosyltrehalose trehalohydrolase
MVQQLPGYQFLGYIQTHDQVGNRAMGRRIGDLTSFRRAKVAAGLVLTAPFLPMLFQGEEWAASTPFRYFTQHENEELGRAVSEGRRNEFIDFGWDASKVPDPQDPMTFEISKLRWQERDEVPHSEMLAWYRSLIRLRRTHPSLTDGNLEVLKVQCDESRLWLTMDRGPVSVVCNLSNEAQRVPVPNARRLLLASEPDVEIAEDYVRLGGDTLAVVATGEAS